MGWLIKDTTYMQFIEQLLQKLKLPHSSMIFLAFIEFKACLSFSSLFMVIRLKKGQGRAMEASGLRDMEVEADEHLINLLNPPLD